MLSKARELAPTMTRIRRAIHRYPELGFQEERTAALVADTLRSLGIQVRTGVGKTGVVGELGSEGPIVALRADMDALPIQEANAVEYASQVPGVMHACGHDAHTTCVLGAAMLLKDLPLTGRVRFLFQPCEEGRGDDLKGGARRMIDDGAFEGVEAAFALHVSSEHPAGTVGFLPGPMLAAVDNFQITVKGTSAHGAAAYLGIDGVLLAAEVVLALHTIVSRRIPGLDPGVITVGTIHGGTKENILADRVELTGTIRSFDAEIRDTLFREIERAASVAKALGGDAEVRFLDGLPATVNHSALTAFARRVAVDTLGSGAVQEGKRVMGAEDFCLFAELAPSVFFRLGSQDPGRPKWVGHNPTFDIDESCLPVGAAVLAQLAAEYLAKQPLKEA